jgi:hypothetical protein
MLPALFLLPHALLPVHPAFEGEQPVLRGTVGRPEAAPGISQHVRTGNTARHHPWLLVYHGAVDTREAAPQADRRVKAWKSRRMIDQMVSGQVEP